MNQQLAPNSSYHIMATRMGEYILRQSGKVINPPLSGDEAKAFQNASQQGLLEKRLQVIPDASIRGIIDRFFAEGQDKHVLLGNNYSE